MSHILKIPPVTRHHLSSPEAIASRLSVLVGTPFKLTGKTRTDGSNIRKLVSSVLLQQALPEPCPAGEYHIVPPKQKGVPRILREYIDTYIVTTGRSYNLQVWNRNPASASVQVEYKRGEALLARDVRFVFVRIDPYRHQVQSVIVLTPEYIENRFGAFGKPTIKHQIIISEQARQSVIERSSSILFYPDTPAIQPLTSPQVALTPQASIHADPMPGEIMPLETIRQKVALPLMGMSVPAGATKNRGQRLETIVANLFGYPVHHADPLSGGYPDIRHQLLEIKIQDSPTVDLGLYSPQFAEPIGIDDQITTADVRYLIALMNVQQGIIEGVILCPGSKLGEHFSYVADTSYKCQRSIPVSFFDLYDGQAVFNP